MSELLNNLLSDPVFRIVVRISLALLFLGAALHKTRQPSQFRSDISAYALLSEQYVPMAAIVLTALEWLLVFTLPISSLIFPLVLSACLLLGYALAILINLRRGRRHIDCGCYGPSKNAGSIRASTISPYLVIRNVLLAGIVLCMALQSGRESFTREVSWLDLLVVLLSLGTVFLLYQSIELFFSQQEYVRQFNQKNSKSMVR